MERNTKEKVAFKQETKSELQELFDELFVGELNEKIANVSSQTTGNIDVLKSIKKQTLQNSIVICDRIDSLKDSLQCVGTVDEWGEETLVSFLNQLSQLLVECKSEVKKQHNFFGSKCEEVTLAELIENINYQLEETHQLIKNVENDTIKHGFEKLFNGIGSIDTVVNSLQSIDIELKVLNSTFDEGGLIKNLYIKQKEISDDLSLYRKKVEEVCRKLDVMCIAVEQITSMLSNSAELQKSEISILNDAITLNNKTVLEKIDCFMLQSQKRVTLVAVGMGFLLLMNIVLFVVSMIK